MRIATIGSDADQQARLRQAIEGLGHECCEYHEGLSLLRDLRQQTFDLLVLDRVLPDVDGTTVVTSIRQDLNLRMPALIISDRSEEAEVVKAFSAGADDFMAQPVRSSEFTARVEALLRRSYPTQEKSELVCGPYRLLPAERLMYVNDAPVKLKQREFHLAFYLFQNIGRLLSREHLHHAVWGPDNGALLRSRSLDTHMSKLRTKLGLSPSNGFLLSASYGCGYRLEALGDVAQHPTMARRSVMS